jgi:hypothetical protein
MCPNNNTCNIMNVMLPFLSSPLLPRTSLDGSKVFQEKTKEEEEKGEEKIRTQKGGLG